jgi:hypothetical protein
MDILLKKSGFTLVELVIIIVLIGILVFSLFMVWPGLSINVNAQAALLADDIRSTQVLSMSRAERFSLTKLSSVSYQIANSTGTVYSTVYLSRNLAFGSITGLPNNAIYFASDGTPYIDNTSPGNVLSQIAVLALSATDGSTASVTIAPTTGRVTP